MMTVTAQVLHEKLGSPDKTFVLSGPPDSLKGTMILSNNTDDSLMVKELPLKYKGKTKSLNKLPDTLKITTFLQPREERCYKVRIKINPQTEPGMYESMVSIGGMDKKLTLIVQEDLKCNIQPSSILFQGVCPGKTYTKEVLISNLGNIPFKIPKLTKSMARDIDYICKSFSLALTEKGVMGFSAFMDKVTKNIHDSFAKWTKLGFAKSGQTVEPGSSVMTTFSITLPMTVDERSSYFGSTRTFNTGINFEIHAN